MTDIKQWLRQARSLQVSVLAKKERIDTLYELCGIKPLQYGERVKGGETQGFSNIIDGIVDFTSELQEEILQLFVLQKQIQDAINKLSDTTEKQALELYYLNAYKWEDVANRMSISDRHLRRIHGAALQNMSLNVRL